MTAATACRRAAAWPVDSEPWACQGCHAPMIGHRPPDGRCPDCRRTADGDVVGVWLAGDLAACDVLTAILAAYPGVQITAQSIRANDHEPGHRLYLTIRLLPDPPARPHYSPSCGDDEVWTSHRPGCTDPACDCACHLPGGREGVAA
jgi:hypothetical protein